MKTDDVILVTYRWDAQEGAPRGWYCSCYRDTLDGERTLVDDSQKLSFPIDVFAYGEGDDPALVRALRRAFPGAEIVRE
jgi:hypothetical protein